MTMSSVGGRALSVLTLGVLTLVSVLPGPGTFALAETVSTGIGAPPASDEMHDIQAAGVIGSAPAPMQFQAPTHTPMTGTGCCMEPPPTVQIPPTCLNPSASVNPNSVPQGGQTTFLALGFASGGHVTLQIFGPGAPNQPPVTIISTVGSLCQLSERIQVFPNDPPGGYTVQASGTGFNGRPLTLTAQFVVTGFAPPPTPGPIATPTTSVVCAFPSAFISPSPIATQQTGTFGGVGFRPGATVRVDFEDTAGLFTFPFFAPTDLGPATTTCAVSGTFSVNPTVPAGRYRLTLTGPNHVGAIVQARTEFEVGSTVGPGPAPTFVVQPTVVIPVEPIPTAPLPVPTAIPPGVVPVAVEQSLVLVGGPPVPAVRQTNTYEHVVRIRNLLAGPLDLRTLGISLDEVLQAAAQGQGLTVSLATEFQDARIVGAVANVGQASVRGSTVIWDGQIGSGQTLELRTTVDHTPTSAFSLNQPIRGQTLTVQDQRGVTLAVPAPPLPQLPPAQRLVQPAPPAVDPTLGSRLFPDTGFAIANDDIWVFYHRRGGRRTFGAPISRQFTLMGSTVQLFERGMLRVDENGGVQPVNLLEDPFLPYESLGDLRLPAVSQFLVETAPDPASGDLSQEFVRLNAPEDFDGSRTRFYTTFLSTVLFRDAFFDGRGDPNLVPGFDLEIWGLPTSDPGYQVIGSELVAGPDGLLRAVDVVDSSTVLLRFQRGVMRHSAADGSTASVPLGGYLRAVLTGQTDNAELVATASASPLWAQYNPGVVDWVDRPDQLPDSNLVLAFEPD